MAAGSTYSSIATTTLGSATASVTFSSLGSYTDIVAVLTPTRSTTGANAVMRFNGDTSTNYSWTQMYGTGSSAVSDRSTNATWINLGYTTTTISTKIIHLQSYNSAPVYKTALIRQSNASEVAQAIVGLWRNTTAITSITFLLGDASNFDTGSTFTLYGIASA